MVLTLSLFFNLYEWDFIIKKLAGNLIVKKEKNMHWETLLNILELTTYAIDKISDTVPTVHTRL
jgi:hypothetical protein